MTIKESIKIAFADRGFMFAWITSAVLFIIVIVLCLIEIRPSDLQVPIRYSAFGITNIYRAQWYNELSMAGFAVLVMVLHTLLSVRLYALKDRRYAVAFQWLTALMFGLTFFVFLAIFRVISIVE